jgi:hypothetical protein
MAQRTAINAETRGKLRIWHEGAQRRYAAMESACHSKEILKAAHVFAKPSGHGRSPAWITLQRTFREVAWLEAVHSGGREPLALWTVIKPRGPVLGAIEGVLTPEEQQASVTMNYLIAGRTPIHTTLGEGLWTAEITVHALGRLLQRDPAANVDAVLLELHRAILRAPSRWLEKYIKEGMVVLAGRGAFLCTCIPPTVNPSSQNLTLLFRAHTWIDRDQMREDQERRANRLAAGSEGITLSTNWLLPDPLRTNVMDCDKIARIL